MFEWLFGVCAAAAAGYSIYRIFWWFLVLLSPLDTEIRECLICHRADLVLKRCDSCGGWSCPEHSTGYSRAADMELVRSDAAGATLMIRSHPVAHGSWCAKCDLKRLLSILVGVVAGDTTFIVLIHALLVG